MRDVKISYQGTAATSQSLCLSVMAALPLFAVLTVVFVSVLNVSSIHGTADQQNP